MGNTWQLVFACSAGYLKFSGGFSGSCVSLAIVVTGRRTVCRKNKGHCGLRGDVLMNRDGAMGTSVVDCSFGSVV